MISWIKSRAREYAAAIVSNALIEEFLEPLVDRIQTFQKKGGRMKGWRTLLVNGGIAGLAAALHYVAGVNLTDYGLNETTATVAMALINFVLRGITTTPIGQKE